MLKKETILQALKRLGELAQNEGLELQVCIYGGAAMMITYDVRNITRDVDVTLYPAERGLALAAQVGEELGLHKHWLNDDVRQFVSDMSDRDGRRDAPIHVEGLKLQVPTANYLLAMKARACREPLPGYEVDSGDLKFLIKKMGIDSLGKVTEQVGRFFPEDPLTDRSRIIIQRLIEEVQNEN